MSEDGLRDAIRKARRKEAERKQRRQVKISLAPKKNPRKEKRHDGEPSTSALEKWGPKEFLDEFSSFAEEAIPNYTRSPAIHELKSVKEFLAILEANDACPRSMLKIIREAARRLPRWKKEWNISSPFGAWWLRTNAAAILHDLRHLLYNDASLRYLMEEEVPVDMITIEQQDECWIFDWQGQSVQLHKSQLETVKNPYLLKKLDLSTTEEGSPDDEDFGGW